MEMCNKSDTEDLSKTVINAGETENVRVCPSPVFKCFNHTKPTRENQLDSSDYDIPSYQINQSVKSRTSSKCGSETNESVLPFSPIFSPIAVAPKVQLQPPPNRTSGPTSKSLEKPAENKINSKMKSFGIFDGLGMTDKDISWASSMASPPPKQVPGSEFNTIERATFFPEEKFHNIQPRALFSPPLDDDFGCQPIIFTSESDEDIEEYKSNVRLSDVCATLKQLEFKSSLEQALDNSLEKGVNKEVCPLSPVIKTKKRKSECAKKKKKGSLVISPEAEGKYEFSTHLKALDCETESVTESNFIDDDSFQSLSFSCLDELCKTLVPSQGDSSVISNDTIVINSSIVNSKQNILKKFYLTKTCTDVHTVSSIDNLHSYVKALEESDKCIPMGKKMDQSVIDKGIVRCDVLSKDTWKVDATKRLHSEVTGEDDKCRGKKMKKVEDEWENVEQYLTESQLNVSDGEIFRTVENLEKSLASQKSKDLEKFNVAEGKEAESRKENCKNETRACSAGNCDIEETEPSPATPGLKISKKAEDVKLKSKSLEISMSGPRNEDLAKASPRAVNFKISEGTTINEGNKCEEKRKLLTDKMCERNELEKFIGAKKQFDVITTSFQGFSTCSGKKIEISAEALEKAKAFMAKCDEKVDNFLTEDFGESSEDQKLSSKIASEEKLGESSRGFIEGYPSKCGKQMEGAIIGEKTEKNSSTFKGFTTGSGKTIQVTAEALEKAKTFLKNCDREFGESSNHLETPWIGEMVNQTFQVKADAVNDQKEKSKGENPESPKPTGSVTLPKVDPPLLGFVTARGNKVTISESALAEAKKRLNEWDDIKPEDSGNFDCNTDSRQKSELKKPGEEQSKLSTTSGFDESDNWDEIIPAWLHVYNTSPSIASDRVDLSPILSHEDGTALNYDREYIVKSPVLGSGDRFVGKSKRQKLRSGEQEKSGIKTGFTVPNKNSRSKAKRTLNLSLDFSVPFKKSKVVEEVLDVGVCVKAGRERAREEQERSIKEKQKVKILKGSHLERKCSEKQISLMEAVGGCFPQVHSDDSLREFGVSEAVLGIDIENAVSVRLKGEDFFGCGCKTNTTGIRVGDDCLLILDDENKFGVEELKRAFLASPGVQPNLVPTGWVENHCKWIIWKLAHYERSFPQYFVGCLTPNQILVQLKFRYDREIDKNERSALKKILERDDTSAKRLVLCVCGIKKILVGETSGYELKLTDGWYSCPARSDPAMVKLIEQGKLPIGTKLLTQGATLVNCEQGASPLEISDDVYLKISTNSTRRVRWDTKLGFQKNPKNFPISLGSILPQGGPISRIDVIIVRVYPVLYMEKTSVGQHVTRNRRLEEKAEAEYRRIQEQRIESIYNEVQFEMSKSLNLDKLSKNHLNNPDQSENFSQLLESSLDPLTLGEKAMCNRIDSFSRELKEKVERKLEKEKLNKRNVSEFLRAKIVDFRKPDYNNAALLSVWNPNEDLIALLSEGKVVSLMNVAISNSTRIYKPLQINTTRQTQFVPIPRKVKYPSRKLTKLKDVSSKVCPAFEEVDIVGMVALIRDVSHGSRLSQVVYLTDVEMNFVGVVFWGSCKDYGWENTLRTPSIVACSNLQWKKSNNFQDVPSLFVNENSVFTENPKHNYLREEIERLKQIRPQDLSDFLIKCEDSLTAKLEDSKWRQNTSKNSSCNDSSLRDSHNCSLVINGFESRPTASSTPLKPFALKTNSCDAEPSPVQKRIEMLQRYGEPPPLVPLLIRNNVKKKFKKNGGGFTTR